MKTSKIERLCAAIGLFLASVTLSVANEADAAKLFGHVCIASAPSFDGAVPALKKAGGKQNKSGQWTKGDLYINPAIKLSGSDGTACSVSVVNTKPRPAADALKAVLAQYGARQISGQRRGNRTVFKFERSGREMTAKVDPFLSTGTSMNVLESRFNVRDFK